MIEEEEEQEEKEEEKDDENEKRWRYKKVLSNVLWWDVQNRNISLSEITEATGWNERSGDFDEKMRRNKEKEEAWENIAILKDAMKKE